MYLLNRGKIGIVLALLLLLVVQSCSVRKFIPEEKFLYTGANLKMESQDEIEDKKELKTELETVISPKPNSKFLGSRFGLYFYYKAQKEHPGFINKFLNKKFGEEPVYLSDADPFQTEKILKNRLENRGYFYSRVDHSVERNDDRKTAHVNYTTRLPEEPYVLENYKMDNDSITIYKEIKQTLDESLLDPGMKFNLPLMKAERERIDNRLKKEGYYNFSSNFLIFEADTNQYDRKKFDLFLRLKKDVPQQATKPYKVKRLNIYPNYVVGSDSIARDTTRYAGKNYIQNEEFFKPKRLDPFILLEEDELYSPGKSSMTSRRLTSIGTYKFVNIRYDELDSLSTDSLGYLEANIYLSPLNKRAIRAELQGVTKSNNFAGPHLMLTYSNRNLFHGGEILNISANVGYEKQLSKGNQAGLSSTQLGLETNLIFPSMLSIIPINNNWFEYSIPKTKISAGFDYMNRSKLFSLFSVSGSYGYIWRANRFITHELNPFSVNYVKLSNTTPRFEEILNENPFLERSFKQEFIAGLTYSFTYNGMIDDTNKHQFFLNSNFDLAGNLPSLLTGGNSAEDYKTFLGLRYAQYVKLDADFRYHFRLNAQQTIATRLYGGLGIPFGNSDIMPFSRQFFAGGPYSIRAFRIRSLGPGAYHPEQRNAYYDQMGNIRLEANIEYRFPIFAFLKGAVFADAGNVWNTKDNIPTNESLTALQKEIIAKGTFGSNFLDQVAVGTGVGLRIDIQNFVIRFDLAAPVRTPWLPKGSRWDFRYDEPVLNFAIGYPF